ncbi:2521_t:CDS:2 [Acaulospora colombiana]|uniref:2521_t:CDS:1 n=1 Tax=Acaulospora colombiana TaxID=27376 RepID=A0ACA9MGV2_9GLOM|nr:2521_t:CDS:2 [Acaulospora colombiana]
MASKVVLYFAIDNLSPWSIHPACHASALYLFPVPQLRNETLLGKKKSEGIAKTSAELRSLTEEKEKVPESVRCTGELLPFWNSYFFDAVGVVRGKTVFQIAKHIYLLFRVAVHVEDKKGRCVIFNYFDSFNYSFLLKRKGS